MRASMYITPVATAMGVALAATAGQAQAGPNVVASIKPVHSLASAVMGATGTPTLLIDGAESPHTYNLAPSEAESLEKADLVVWVGPVLSPFLASAMGQIASPEASLRLMAADGVATRQNRVAGPWSGQARGQGNGGGHGANHTGDDPARGDDHAHSDEPAHAAGADQASGRRTDPHIWLDPDNAIAMAEAIEARLSALDPENSATYAAHLAELRDRIAGLDTELAERLGPVADSPYVVFHDAYQYFESHYGLRAVGSLTLSPDRRPSAQRLHALRQHLAETGAACVFREPQFAPDLVAPLTEGTDVTVAVLDPLGAELAPGPDQYPGLMQAMADSLRGCLAG